MSSVSQAIAAYLQSRRTSNNGDLVDRYHAGMEVQVNVAAGMGEAVDGRRSTWTDGVRSWHHIRVPKHADSEPTFNDYEMRFSLDEHAEAVGMTGWNFVERSSVWCGFDFDSITGHAAGVGISKDQLEAVKAAAVAVPWVEVRKSTGGSGLHLYVYFDQHVPTANHTEHAALARAVLSLLSTAANFDFAAQIDACGNNMWVSHKKLTLENEGLKIVKAATRGLLASEVPANWRDHAEVVTRKRAKIRVQGIAQEQDFESLATSRKFVPLDDKHKTLIAKLGMLGHSTIWVGDYHLLQTHTLGLQQIVDDPELRSELGIVGFFQTISSGSTASNCFMFPLADGAWKVCRFTWGLHEARTWTQDGVSWTWCYFNRVPDLNQAARAMGGVEQKNNKGWKFSRAADAFRAAGALGELISVGPEFSNRAAVLATNKDGRLVVDIKQSDGDASPGYGWSESHGWWSKVCNARTEGAAEDVDEADNLLRVVVTPAGESAGTFVKSASGAWDCHTTSLVKMYLQGLGFQAKKCETMIGGAVRRRWEKVCLPFQSEYPGDRRWNLGAPQLRYQPSNSRDNLVHPYWDKLLEHVGGTLTPYLKELEWAQKANVRTGGDYLRCWFASILREPFSPLPYLFLHGPEKSGKTLLWEAFELLVTSGVVKADRVLTGNNEFNAELVGAILCVIEERDVSKTDGAMSRIRDYVTASMLSIRAMRRNAYQVPNTTHWLQTTNNLKHLSILHGDTRTTGWYVPVFQGPEIPKEDFKDKLRSEAPSFLRTLLDLVLPPPMSRLRIPIVDTDHKRGMNKSFANPVEQYLAEEIFENTDQMVTVKEFCTKVKAWLLAEEKEEMSDRKILQALPPQYPHCPHSQNVSQVGNLTYDKNLPVLLPGCWIRDKTTGRMKRSV